MALLPYNVSVQDTQGRALSGATVWFCTQPAIVANPPSPLATVYSSTAGASSPNPLTTNGYGQVVAYLDNTTLYTVVIYHELIGLVSYADQWVGGPSGSTFTLNLAFVGGSGGQAITGTVPGTVFTLPATPNPPGALILIQNGLVLLQGLGYTLAGAVVTLANGLQIGDSLAALVPATT